MHSRYWIAIALALITTTASGQSAREHINLGDRRHAALDAAGALGHYERAIAADATSYEAAWKASRSAMDIGSAPSAGNRGTLFATAERYARKAVALDQSDAEGHFALARALGKNALTQSPRGRVKYGTEVRAQALECLRRSPRHAGCMHVMGVWNAEVMKLNGFTKMIAKNLLGGRVLGSASWKEAVRYMEEAVAIDPQRIIHWLDIGEIYNSVGEPEKARSAFETVVRLPVSDVNDSHYKEQARQMLSIR